jgi:hypothetical protein
VQQPDNGTEKENAKKKALIKNAKKKANPPEKNTKKKPRN